MGSSCAAGCNRVAEPVCEPGIAANVRERMGVIAACREVGGYRGATAMCGTTHKTVKRIERRSWSRVPSKRPQSVPHGFARRPDTYRRHPISNEQASRRATEHGPAGPRTTAWGRRVGSSTLIGAPSLCTHPVLAEPLRCYRVTSSYAIACSGRMPESGRIRQALRYVTGL